MMHQWSCGCCAISDNYYDGDEKCSQFPACVRGEEIITSAKKAKIEELRKEKQQKRDEIRREQAMKKLTKADKRILGLL